MNHRSLQHYSAQLLWTRGQASVCCPLCVKNRCHWGDNTFVFGNATTHPSVSKTLSEICLRLCNPCQFCPHGCGTSRCAGGFLHSQIARERLLLPPLPLASCSQSNLVKIPQWLSAGLPQGDTCLPSTCGASC